MMLSRVLSRALPLAALCLLAACAPEVGSKRWCDQLKEKPKGEWSGNEAADYAKHCLFGGGDEEK